MHGKTLILKYSDFGPQAMAYETIGQQWWQWQSTGSDNAGATYDIKVVVYQGMPPQAVAQRYPVNEKTKQDYRYLKLENAMDYLDRNIKEDVLPEVTALLRKSRHKITAYFKP